MDNLQRAAERIDHLQAIVRWLNEKSVGMDNPSGAPEVSKKVGPTGVPEEFSSAAMEAIQAVLDALVSMDRGVHHISAGRPPEWWRDLKAVVGNEREKYAASHPALLDYMIILDRYVGEGSANLGSLIFLVDRLDLKMMSTGTGLGFRAVASPNSKGINFSFDAQIDNEIDQPLHEFSAKFPFSWKNALRSETSLNKARDVLGH